MKKIIFALIMGASVALAVFTPPDSGDSSEAIDYAQVSAKANSAIQGITLGNVSYLGPGADITEAADERYVEPAELSATNAALQSQISAIDTNAIITASVSASATNNTAIYFEGGGSITFTNGAFFFDDGE